MSKIVYKYELDPYADTVLMLPPGAQILHVGVDYRRKQSIWIMIDKDADCDTEYTFFIKGTGCIIKETNIWHIGTYMDSPFIWHVFQKL